jgi:hypothetical protein
MTMRIANNNDLRNAAIKAQEADDMQTVAALSLIALLPVEEAEAEEGEE